MKNDIQQIWFDFAGTLYRETSEFNAVHDQLRDSTFAKVKGITDKEVAKQEFLAAYEKYGSNSAVFRALGKSHDFWSDALNQMDFGALLTPDSEVTETLTKLKEIVPLSIFTNFIKPRVVKLLNYLEIPADYFTYWVTGDEIVERKPVLRGFHAMIEKSGIQAKNILYVGDRVSVDIRPAKTVGIQTCLVYGQSDEADYCFDSFKGLISLIAED